MKTLSVTRIFSNTWFKYALIIISFVLGLIVLGYATPLAFGQSLAGIEYGENTDELLPGVAEENGVNQSPYFQGRGRRGFARGTYKMRVSPNWFDDNNQFWYRNDLPNQTHEFILVNADEGKRSKAFDHAKLAKSLSETTGEQYSAEKLPFRNIRIDLENNAVNFALDDQLWACKLDDYTLEKVDGDVTELEESPPRFGQGRGRGGQGRGGQGRGGQGRGRGRAGNNESPDGKYQVSIRENNVHIREGDGEWTALTDDGRESRPYTFPQWSPDSGTIVAYRVRRGDEFEVHLIESSPDEGGRAQLRSRRYPLPGDRFSEYELNLFDVASKSQTRPDVDVVDFGFPRIRWDEERGHFTYEKVDRGHQRYRLIDINAKTGDAKNLIDEQTDTFVWTAHVENVQLRRLNWLENSNEIIYYSESDGWRHLYLVDSVNGGIKHQITKGEYVVRSIERIDEENRQIWFTASGKNKDQDPYLIHYYRVNFDGSELVELTTGNGNHSIVYSPDQKYFIDTFSRVDMAPVHELRRSSDGNLVCELEKADISELEKSGFKPPEVFSAKGRDGKTDIWGVITTPRDFDPAKKYPIIEYIYAGPQDSFVPKTFSPRNQYTTLANRGYVVVQIDGMGTANRSKAFHDVCWKNLKDAGFPDRILWIKAAAQSRAFMDTERVGVYGGSAGGQNAAGAVLFHPDFYKVASANCGCHDNRMDKSSWNEQWMGYPVGPQYSECSNIDNAHRLQGHLQLIIGELDTNVPPESTYRLCDALIKADKDFELIFIPGAGHGASQAYRYHQRRMFAFFDKHLKGVEAGNYNAPAETETTSGNNEGRRQNNRQSRNTTDTNQDEDNSEAEDEKATQDEVEVPATLKLSELKPGASRVTRVLSRYQRDRRNLERYYEFDITPNSQKRMLNFDAQWYSAVSSLSEEDLNQQERDDLNEFKLRLLKSVDEVGNVSSKQAEAVKKHAPFAPILFELFDDRLAVKQIEASDVAAKIDELAKQTKTALAKFKESTNQEADSENNQPTDKLQNDAADLVAKLHSQMRSWYRFYDSYDPLFSWWVKAPHDEALAALEEYSEALAASNESEESDGDSQQTVAYDEGRAKQLANENSTGNDVPDLNAMIAPQTSFMELVINKYNAESRSRWRGRGRRSRDGGQAQNATETHTTEQWLAALDQLDFDELPQSGKVDYLLLKNRLQSATSGGGRQRFQREAANPVDASGIRGRPIGREQLIRELEREMIPYAPDQLIDIAMKEYEWCQDELKKATKEMGYGEDCDAAVEHVKKMHVKPGEQPVMIRELAWEAIDYLNEHQLVTVPNLAAETWQMRMMSPQRQLINPFFTGGSAITVSFPTDTMSHDAKLQSMRGNNIPFSRATVHHELIPGHNLQLFMNSRYNDYRNMFDTPFWREGWALYWEMVLYDRGFPKTPEDRIGFLVWRKHRCARIVFSLSFHLGRMTPSECIDFLVEKVGFDRNNATAEVRRSFEQAPPLYQAAYMVGGLQFRSLRKELVDSGKMPEKEFHDAILQAGIMPVEMVRATLTDQELTKDFKTNWFFYDKP